MGGDAGKIIIPIAVGIGAGFAAPALAGSFGAGKVAVTAKALAAKGATLNAAQSAALASVQGQLATGGFSTMSAIGTGMAANNMMTPDPQMPDYGGMFQQQQGLLEDQHSFGRKNTADLEGLLEFGSTHEKNQAFDELQRRGEDEARLLEIQTRNERTAENQDEIDRYVDSATPPTDEEMQGLIANLKAAEYRELEEDIDKELTNVSQIMLRRGLGSSNAMSQFQARLAEVEHRGKLAIDKDVQDRVLSFQQGVEGIRNEGLNRIMKGAGFEDTASRYNLQLGQQERNLQEGLRASRTQQTNTLGLEKFRADVDAMNTKFKQESANQRANAMLGLGAMNMATQFGSNRIPVTPNIPDINNPFQKSNELTAYSSFMPDWREDLSGVGG